MKSKLLFILGIIIIVLSALLNYHYPNYIIIGCIIAFIGGMLSGHNYKKL